MRRSQTGPPQRLFEVTPPGGGSVGTGEAVEAVEASDKAAAALVGEQSRMSANMWVRRTGWPRRLRGFDCRWLAATT
jgi:hypothetical protein